MVGPTIGVDIGLKGAIAVIDTLDPESGFNPVTGLSNHGVRVWNMPTRKVKKLCTRGKRKGLIKNITVYNIEGIHDILMSIFKNKYYNKKIVCFVEEAIIKPCGYNIKTNIGLARCQAIFEGLLSALHIEYHTVIPQDWQKAMGLTGKKKSGDANVKLAQQKYPGVSLVTPKGRVLDGVADALLIAEYGRDHWGPQGIPNWLTENAMKIETLNRVETVDDLFEELDDES